MCPSYYYMCVLHTNIFVSFILLHLCVHKGATTDITLRVVSVTVELQYMCLSYCWVCANNICVFHTAMCVCLKDEHTADTRTSALLVSTLLCVCVCVCVWKREREKARERERESARERARMRLYTVGQPHIYVPVYIYILYYEFI